MTARLPVLAFLLFVAFLTPEEITYARSDPAGVVPASDQIPPDGVHVLDGSYVLNVGELRVNITNFGLIGSRYSGGYIYSHAASGEWPGGTGNEYLWGAGLWIGGRLGGAVSVTTGQLDQELRPSKKLVDTIYEARRGFITRPFQQSSATGNRFPSANADDDRDGSYDEDMLNGVDDDGDGQVDEDFGQLGDQMFTCTMYDDLPLIQQIYPEHRPLGLKVVQRAIAYDRELRENVIGLDFEIKNVGHKEITDIYLGFYADCDIQNRNVGEFQPDDMAGSFSGIVRADDGFFYRAEIAYMWDGAKENPLPGYFGVQLLDHTVAFDGVTAPFAPFINTFKIFSTSASINQGGEPLSDIDRYYVMSHAARDRNTRDLEQGDLKVLISAGPFGPLKVGHSLDYKLGLIIGNGMQGMLDVAAEAGKLYSGRWYDVDGLWHTGWGGRETKVCLGDYPKGPFGTEPLIGRAFDGMDESCGGGEPQIGRRIIMMSDFLPDEDRRYCIWVNMDNCTECMRNLGRECGGDKAAAAYSWYQTGTWGRETHYPWTIAHESPPVPPRARTVAGDRSVEIFWDDRSEIVPDPVSNVVDFESYRVWRVRGWVPPGGMTEAAAPPARAWGMVAEFDLINEIPAEASPSSRPIPLGRNTGLKGILYEPVCLADERFAGLPEAMQVLVDSDVDGNLVSRPPVRLFDRSVTPGMESLVRWEAYPDVLDTFFAVTERKADAVLGIPAKRATRFYHYIDTDLHNGFYCYYAVLARDHLLTQVGGQYVPAGIGIEDDPSNYFHIVLPRPDGQTVAKRKAQGANIYVYPNPATRESLAEFQSREPSIVDPTGVRVMFNNLPLANNTIRIYTVAGDLLETLYHDGYSEGGATSWNLMTRNRQEVVSGVYLYSVHSDEDGFEPFRGRFVVIR